jgi:hypothetical protein
MCQSDFDFAYIEDWGNMMKRISSSLSSVSALQAASEAMGYLRCLERFNLVSVDQRNAMALEIEEACANKTVTLRK